MISEAKPAATTIANTESRALTAVLVPCGATLAAMGVFDGPQWAQHAPLFVAAVYVVAVAAASIWLFYRGWRIGVRFDDHGVTARGFWQADRYGWPEVSHFADGCAKTEGGQFWALNVVLHDAGVVTLKATTRKKTASPKILATIGQVAARYQIPAELTGEPQTLDGPPANPGLYPDPGGKGMRRWDGNEWSPLLQPDPASGGPEGKAPGEVWSPLPGSQQQWHDAASGARRAGIALAGWLAVTAGAVALTVVLYAQDLSKPHADFTLAVWALISVALCLAFALGAWQRRKDFKKIDRAGRAAAGLAETGSSTASPHDDQGEGTVADLPHELHADSLKDHSLLDRSGQVQQPERPLPTAITLQWSDVRQLQF